MKKAINIKKIVFFSFVFFVLTIALNAIITWFTLLHQTKNELAMLSQETLYTTNEYLNEAQDLLDKALLRKPKDCSLTSREVFIPELLSAVIVTDILYTLPDKTVCSLTYGDTISSALPKQPITTWHGMQIYLLSEGKLAAGKGNVLIGKKGVFALLPHQQLARFYFIGKIQQPQQRIMINNAVVVHPVQNTRPDSFWLVTSKGSNDGIKVDFSFSFVQLYRYWLVTFWPTQWAVNILSLLLFCLFFYLYVHHQLSMKTAIRRALKKGEYRLYYQPIVEIKTGKIHSLEALIRWPISGGGEVPAEVFIPIAEKTGLICSITHYVLRQTMSDLNLLHRTHPELKVAVNISANDLSTPNFAVNLLSQCAYYRLSPQDLKLEITERSLVHDENAQHNMQRLSEEGFMLVLDDFGTGYSSLSYLNKLPVKELKIDRSFIMRLGMNIAIESVVPQIVSIAHQLNMSVIAEGVETKEQAQALFNLQVQYAQGWFYDKAMPLSDIQAKLELNKNCPHIYPSYNMTIRD